jgi:hypothetical protein
MHGEETPRGGQLANHEFRATSDRDDRFADHMLRERFLGRMHGDFRHEHAGVGDGFADHGVRETACDGLDFG